MTVDAIKQAIVDLPEDQKFALAAWLNQQTMDDWEKKMQRDFSPGGRGNHLVEEVKNQIRAGKFQPMPEERPRTAE